MITPQSLSPQPFSQFQFTTKLDGAEKASDWPGSNQGFTSGPRDRVMEATTVFGGEGDPQRKEGLPFQGEAEC